MSNEQCRRCPLITRPILAVHTCDLNLRLIAKHVVSSYVEYSVTCTISNIMYIMFMYETDIDVDSTVLARMREIIVIRHDSRTY